MNEKKRRQVEEVEHALRTALAEMEKYKARLESQEILPEIKAHLMDEKIEPLP